MLLRVFEEEHEEQVNHCQFTNTTRRVLLATCSNDKFMNVKVCECGCTELFLGSLVLPFHFFSFCFSVQLWNLNKPSSQNTMFGHYEPVNHCCFSPDDTYVSTSSNDGTTKVITRINLKKHSL